MSVLKSRRNENRAEFVNVAYAIFTETLQFLTKLSGKVIVNGNRDGIKRARRKIKAFKPKLEKGLMTYKDLWTSAMVFWRTLKSTTTIIASLNSDACSMKYMASRLRGLTSSGKAEAERKV